MIVAGLKLDAGTVRVLLTGLRAPAFQADDVVARSARRRDARTGAARMDEIRAMPP